MTIQSSVLCVDDIVRGIDQILGLCLGWKGQGICCVTRGEGGREGKEGNMKEGRGEGGRGGRGGR